MRTLIGALMMVAFISPAMAEMGCIADASVHASIEGLSAFDDSGARVVADHSQREPIGHSAACHLGHHSHNQLLAAGKGLPPKATPGASRQYWIAAVDLLAGRRPAGTIRPPRA